MQVTLEHIDPMCFLSGIYTSLHALIGFLQHHTFRIWVHTWLVVLSHAVLSIVQVFHIYDVGYGLCLGVRDVISHPLRCDLIV
jgi:hypothetical protein